MQDDEDLKWYCIGQPIGPDRSKKFERNIRALLTRGIGPKEILRVLVDEIISTSRSRTNSTVGEKILGFCIPKNAVEAQFKTGHSSMISSKPDHESVTFTNFEPSYSELVQYGPAYVCGEFAVTDIKTEIDHQSDFQSSEMRIVRLPDKKP